MIQINLLPDVKMQYLKVRRTQRLVISISTLLIIASVTIFVLLIGTVDVVQKKNLSDLNSDIGKYKSQLQNTPDLNKILTIQNQLGSLTTLHDQKPADSRMFGYLQQLTPANASISEFDIDWTQNTISITGDAPSLDVINAYTDTLKFTTYKGSDGSSGNAFSSVVLSEFSRDDSGATYTITANFDPAIFDITKNVTLTVPSIISTRSVTQQPSDLFQSHSTAQNSGSQ